MKEAIVKKCMTQLSSLRIICFCLQVINNILYWCMWWLYDLTLKLRWFIILGFQNPIYLQLPHKNTIEDECLFRKRMLWLCLSQCFDPMHRIVGQHESEYALIPSFLPVNAAFIKLRSRSPQATNHLPHNNSYSEQNIELRSPEHCPLPSKWIKSHYIIICCYWFISIEEVEGSSVCKAEFNWQLH